MKSNTIAIVDAYRSALDIVAACHDQDLNVIQVQSSHKVPQYLLDSADKSLFSEWLIIDKDLSRTVAQLNRLGVKTIMPGHECGIEAFDSLSNAFGSRHNPINTSAERRNKWSATEAVAHARLNHINQIKSSHLQEIIDWQNDLNTWPVVLKPLKSTGSDGVYICESTSDITTSFNLILGSVNRIGFINDEVLAQEFIKGNEYCINSISIDGTHKVLNSWKYTRIICHDKTTIYDCDELVTDQDLLHNVIYPYVSKALDAIGLSNGPSHMEIKITPEGNPVMIEAGARIDGVSNRKLEQDIIGFDQARLTVDLYTNQMSNLEILPLISTPKSYAMIVFLISKNEGKIATENHIRFLSKLESFHSFVQRFNPKLGIRKTIDTISSPGFVFLTNTSKRQMLSDYKNIRQAEDKGHLFDLNL